MTRLLDKKCEDTRNGKGRTSITGTCLTQSSALSLFLFIDIDPVFWCREANGTHNHTHKHSLSTSKKKTVWTKYYMERERIIFSLISSLDIVSYCRLLYMEIGRNRHLLFRLLHSFSRFFLLVRQWCYAYRGEEWPKRNFAAEDLSSGSWWFMTCLVMRKRREWESTEQVVWVVLFSFHGRWTQSKLITSWRRREQNRTIRLRLTKKHREKGGRQKEGMCPSILQKRREEPWTEQEKWPKTVEELDRCSSSHHLNENHHLLVSLSLSQVV